MASPAKPEDRPPSNADTPNYQIGFKKPPLATRFQKGCSGNPRGRPKGARNKRAAPNEERLKSLVLAEAYRTIKVNEGDRKVTLSMTEAILRALAVNAARGQLRSAQAFMGLLGETERANKAHHDEYLRTMIEYKVDWERELERRARLRVTGPEPLPHPDDIVVDFKTDQIRVLGPMSKEDKVKWDRLWDRVEECDRAIAEYTNDLKDPKNRKVRDFIRDEIDQERRIRQIIVSSVGEPRRRR